MNKMKNVMNICTIDDIAIINRGKSKHRPRGDSILYGGNYPFIQTSEIKKSILHINDYENTYNEVGLAQSKLWEKGTLCLTIAANIAETGILDFDACFPDSVVGIIPKEGIADTIYIKYLMDMVKVYMQQISKGTTQDNLSLEKIRKVKFEIPIYEQQLKIADFLSKYDILIENNNKRIKILEQMAEELYKEWFARTRLPKKSEQDKCDIRKEWKIGKLSDIAKITGESIKTEAREAFDYYVPIDCIDSKSITLKRYESISNAISSLQSFKTGDILFGAMRPYFHKVCLAPFDGITRKTCFVINSIDSNYRNYVLLTLFQKSTIDFASSISIGSTMPYVGSFRGLGRLKIIIPDKKTITEFNKILNPILEMLAILSKKNENLVKQRDLLLPRLMSGKLEVK